MSFGSPAVDEGAAARVPDDIDGEPRPMGVRTDLGATEVSRVSMPLVLCEG